MEPSHEDVIVQCESSPVLLQCADLLLLLFLMNYWLSIILSTVKCIIVSFFHFCFFILTLFERKMSVPRNKDPLLKTWCYQGITITKRTIRYILPNIITFSLYYFIYFNIKHVLIQNYFYIYWKIEKNISAFEKGIIKSFICCTILWAIFFYTNFLFLINF